MVQHHKLECPVGKWDYCVHFEVNVTAKVKNVSE